MVRRWLQSASVEIDDTTGAMRMAMDPPAGLAGGIKTVAATGTPEPLTAVSTPCKFVWLGARTDADGTALNTKPVFVGDGSEQHIPLVATNLEGVVVGIDDAGKLYIKVGVNGEGVAFHIFT